MPAIINGGKLCTPIRIAKKVVPQKKATPAYASQALTLAFMMQQ
jgi:hypothetical protein